MKLAAFDAVAKALDAARVRYLVAGGLAVNAHGYIRLTMDIDLVIALDAGNIRQAFNALAGTGYRPTVPIDAEAFAQPEQRQRWREDKGMQVLNFQSDAFPGTSVDVFVYEPFDFAHEYDIAMRGELLPGINVRFVSIPTLIRMKQAAGRPRDLDDIQHLQWLQENPDE
ncbi:nucleotidyl transferase AbiEii/AbiGii toxin family protein [Thioalkalivibrio thiocyanodenitrificans]|uniref:nucleotidyl transferase AbiEii/AbiGii toxin family protein n=1 Tax=Thioalkalivibrio thiocyanodenitrificans TaxID=243063 RepID=UPI00035F632E|nr:nucleotidyl transferase AbiEii/AbiGii toxin family protein [Thioalkalivibrio thiocyanodenitrificans]